jgi:GAF domain-containing protein
MVSSFTNLFTPPIFDDPKKATQARNLYNILLGTLIITFMFLIYAIFFPPIGQIIAAGIAIVVEFGLLVLVNSRRITLASGILTFTLWIATLIVVILYGGIRATGFGVFAAIILIAGLTIGARGSIFFTTLTLLAAGGLAFSENQGFLPPYPNVPIVSVLLSHSIALIAIALLLNLAIRNISTVAWQAAHKENKEKGMDVLLGESQLELEKRESILEQRNINLQAVAAISRITNQVKTEPELLEQSAKLLIEQNKLEHVEFFALDLIEENLILQTSRSQAGKFVARAANNLNVIRSESAILIGVGTLHCKLGEWNYYIDPPKQLPEMTTSLSIPLVSGERLYGLLNIQSASTDIQKMDMQTLQMLADQIALSMANIRLITQLQNRVQEIDRLEGRSVKNAWEQLGIRGIIGYSYDRLQILPADQSFPSEITTQLLDGRSVSFKSVDIPPRARLAAPIILRGTIIGAVGYDSTNIDHEWQDDEKALLETVASRVSLALENSRLVAEAQERADRERAISQVTTKMRETLDIETILKTAVTEMRRSLELSEAEVRLQFVEEGKPTEVSND